MESVKAALKGKNREYPYVLRTDFSVFPDKVSYNVYGHFICIPDPTSQTKTWGFEDEAGMGLFRLDYSGCLIK